MGKREKMPLEEAIEHCIEVAEKNEEICKLGKALDKEAMMNCAHDHRQLAEWLEELKERREQPKQILEELYYSEDAVNMTGEYQGLWVRWSAIEKALRPDDAL